MEKKQIFEKIIKDIFLSKRLQEYLIDNFEVLGECKISEIIGCSLLSVDEKYNYAKLLGLRELEEDCVIALSNMRLKSNEIFYLKQYSRNDVYELIKKQRLENINSKYMNISNLKECTEIIEDITCCLNSPIEDAIKPFFDFDNIIKYIKLVSEDETKGNSEYTLKSYNDYYYFIVEKWIKKEKVDEKYRFVYDFGDMELVGKYYIVNQKVVFFEKLTNGFRDYKNKNVLSDSANLNIPIPFEEGDILNINMKPFMDDKNILIISKTGNQDCCSVQALYIDEKGMARIGGLKHSSISKYHDSIHCVSPLYRITDEQPILNENEQNFLSIKSELKDSLSYEEKKETVRMYYKNVKKNDI